MKNDRGLPEDATLNSLNIVFSSALTYCLVLGKMNSWAATFFFAILFIFSSCYCDEFEIKNRKAEVKRVEYTINKFIDDLLNSQNQTSESRDGIPSETNSNSKIIDSMYVFGDSYVDCGNRNRSSTSFQYPYGETWPGRPAGRFSDGKNIADWLADSFGISRPSTYRKLKSLSGNSPGRQKTIRQGINFAVGGSGLLAAFGYPKFSRQIDWFESLIKDGSIRNQTLKNSIIVVSTANNDYLSFIRKNQNFGDLPKHVTQIFTELSICLRRLGSLGVQNIVITNLMPVGCLPAIRKIFQIPFKKSNKCSYLANLVPPLHNLALNRVVDDLHDEVPGMQIVVADIHKAFRQAFDSPETYRLSDTNFACCDPKHYGIYCGSQNINFTVCSDPKQNFFWDSVHLTNHGFKIVSDLFYEGNGFTKPGPNLKTIFKK